MSWNIDDITLRVQGDDLVIREEIPFLDLSIQLNTRRVSTFEFTTLPLFRVTENLVHGSRVAVFLGSHLVIEGFVDIAGGGWNAGDGKEFVRFTGTDDLTLVADTLAWVRPETSTGGRELADIQRSKDGPSEDIALEFIQENIGVTRHANRTIDGVTGYIGVSVPVSSNRGPTRNVSAHYDPLMDVVRECLEDSDLDVKVRVNAARDGFELEVVEFGDPGIHFSKDRYNLQSYEWQEAIPKYNQMILALETYSKEVPDPDTPTEDITVRERRIRGRHNGMSNFFDWGLRERQEFFDPGDLREFDESDPPEPQDDGTVAASDYAIAKLIEAQEETWVKAVLISTPQTTLFEDFNLGDLVNIHISDRDIRQERITAIVIKADTSSGRLELAPVTGIIGRDPLKTREEERMQETAEAIRKQQGR